ncbi:177_t:CDS:2 [Gigaspora margarita]|uniref:177_t:CDS:1 n=1 Tax=Gigaspora margarita TaxID=4874 RepID=A0ABN7ULT5_GIGMA|nr:177_t:CDS:2 [Gigaspora margarita]
MITLVLFAIHYHALNEIYLQIDFIKPFFEELKKLEQADLPQENDIARVLCHNAPRGCHLCKLEQKWNKHQIETAGFVSTSLETNNLLREIMNAYLLYYLFEQALLEPNRVKLFGKDDSKFGKITSIIEHLWNNDQAFIFFALSS